MQMDPAKLDIPEPLQKKEQAIQLVVHVRVDRDRGGASSQCPRLADLAAQAGSSVQGLRDGFVEHLQQLDSRIWCGARLVHVLFLTC